MARPEANARRTGDHQIVGTTAGLLKLDAVCRACNVMNYSCHNRYHFKKPDHMDGRVTITVTGRSKSLPQTGVAPEVKEALATLRLLPGNGTAHNEAVLGCEHAPGTRTTENENILGQVFMDRSRNRP